jgi:hypothetical protein
VATSAGDFETLTLGERNAGGLIFTNLVPIVLGDPQPSNGVVEARHGTELYALHNGGSVTGRTLIDLALVLAITTTPVYVPLQQQSFSVAGTQNGTVNSGLTVWNETTGESHPFTALGEWTAPATVLTTGLNLVHVLGTNAFGFAATSTVELTLCGPSGVTNFVARNGGHGWPFLSPATAATSLHAAVAAAYHGNIVRVSTGTYAGGLLVDKRIHVQGDGSAVIDGGGTQVCVAVTGWGVIDNVTVRNGAHANGGGVELEAGTLINSIVESNRAELGGGVYCHNYTLVSNCVIRGNDAQRGGGAYCNYSATVACSRVTGNAGHDRAGGVYCFYGRVHDSYVGHNITTNRGGGIYAGRGSTVQRCTVVSNWAKYFGGGVYLLAATMRESSLIGNYADSHGGGLYANRDTAAINSVICDNWSKTLGGGIYFKFGTITNCTVTGNRSASVGGGVLCDPGRMVNSIIYHNSAVVGDEYYSADDDTVIKYCTTYPMPPAGEGNLTNAPLLMDMLPWEPRLRAGSPCRDSGSNAFAPSAVDRDGNPRIVNGTVDIGAYEFALGALDCYFAADRTNVLPLESVRFDAEAWGSNTVGLAYAWDCDGDGAVDYHTNAPQVVHSYTDEGLYSVTVTVSNAVGDAVVATRDAYVHVVPEPLVPWCAGLIAAVLVGGRGTTPNSLRRR